MPTPNELGYWRKTFSQMSSELHKLYRSLETSVEEKTHDLHEARTAARRCYTGAPEALNTSKSTSLFRHILQN